MMLRYLFLLCFFILAGPALAEKNAQSLDGIAAIVNTDVISESELSNAIDKTKKQMTASHVSIPDQLTLRTHVLDQLINRKLQFDLAKQNNIKVSEAELDKAVKTIAEGNHISVAELYSLVEKQGLSRKAYQNEIKEQFLLHKVQQAFISRKISISPNEVDAFMHSTAWQALSTKEYHIEDILLALPDAPAPQQVLETKEKALALVARLRKGANFQATAMAESNSNPALQGGDLGWRKLPEVPSAFSDVLLQMKENEIYGPIQTPNGFHIIHLAGIREASQGQGNPPLEKRKVQELLYNRKYEEALQTWTMQLREGSYIKIYPAG